MSKKKQNCWEHKKCGNGPEDPGKCPAATDRRLDGVHGGHNAGRACWVIEGTLCDNAKQGSFSEKLGHCLDCKFYRAVLREEGEGFQMVAEILMKLKGSKK